MKKIILMLVIAFGISCTPVSQVQANQIKGAYNCNDVRMVSGMSEDQIRNLLPYRMKELSSTIYNIERSNRPINAFFLISLMRLETGNGTSYSYRVKNNVGGVMRGRTTAAFKSKRECLYYMQNFLYKGYINQRRISVVSIGNKYCVGGSWSYKVHSIAMGMYTK